MRRWQGLLFLLGMIAGASHAATPVKAEYAEATDVFNVLDNLPDWLPGYTASVYGDYWEKHIGLDTADRSALAAYAEFRQRTAEAARENGADDPAGAGDLFAPASTRQGDSFALHFLEASRFESGAASAIAAQTPKDRTMLRAYYARFGARALRLVRAQSHFDSQRAALMEHLASPAVPVFTDALGDFYGVGPAPAFVARMVWWPDSESTQAKVRGRYILLHSQPDGAAEPMDWAPIVLHEYAHYLSAGQSTEQKRRLTAAFLQRCPAAAELPNPLNALEEPLAIYWGQYRFEHDVRGRELPVADDWYFKPLADHVAKAIAAAFPASGPAPKLKDPALLAAAGNACADAP
ncbi:MAG: hypothetical protein ACREO0_02195 [Pseudoxanthomonas sp.]